MADLRLGKALVMKNGTIRLDCFALAGSLIIMDYIGDFDAALKGGHALAACNREVFENQGFLSDVTLQHFLSFYHWNPAPNGGMYFFNQKCRRILVHPETFASILILWDYTGDLEYAITKSTDFRAWFSPAFACDEAVFLSINELEEFLAMHKQRR